MVVTPQADPRRRNEPDQKPPMLNGIENPVHLLFLFLIVLLVFGAKRLPEIGRGLGTGMRDFKNALTQSQVPNPPRQPTDRSPQTQPTSAADRRVGGTNAPRMTKRSRSARRAASPLTESRVIDAGQAHLRRRRRP